MARAAVKATPTRPKKATPSNRGHGEKGVAKYDPSKHPRDANGRFLSKGGAAGAGPKTAKAPKAPKAKVAKPPAKPKPPKKVGTAKQRKGLADQIREARAKAKTPEAKKALLKQVRDLRQKRAEWKRGQGKTQVEKLPKPPKTPKEAKPKKEAKPRAPKEPKVKAEKKATEKKAREAKPKVPGEPKAPKAKKTTAKGRAETATDAGDTVMRRAKALQDRYKREGAADISEMSKLAGERHGMARDLRDQRRTVARLGKRVDAARVAAASKGDLQAQTELLLRKPPAEMQKELIAFVDKHKGIAFEVKTGGMGVSEQMHSVQFGQHRLYFPKGDRAAENAASTARNLVLGDQLHPELARHTKGIYLTNQRNRHDAHWEQEYGIAGFKSAATGGDGNVTVYNGGPMGAGTFAHEAGHNLATARYGDTKPYVMSDFMVAARREPHPTEYAKKSPAEDFAESVMLHTTANAKFKSTNPLRYAVVDRMLREPSYGG
jgi:hypothetical protein